MLNLNQITIPTLNLDTSISFYQKLGLHLIVHAPPHYARFECPEGASTFSIHLVDKLPSGSGIIVYFECSDLDAYVDSLLEKGIAFEEQPNDKRWLWREAKPKGSRWKSACFILGWSQSEKPTLATGKCELKRV